MDPTEIQKTTVAGLHIMYGNQYVKHFAPDKAGRIRCELLCAAGTHIWYVDRNGGIDTSSGVTQRLFDAPAQVPKPTNAQAN